jgi:hypothetical protein
MNIHSEYIDARIKTIQNKWNSKVVDTSHDDFVRDYSSSVFTNLVHATFSKTRLAKYPCSDCGAPSTDRCHGIGEERPVLLRRALERVWPDTSKPVLLRDIVVAFLEEHKTTKFTFKCHPCHLKESYTIDPR